MTLEAAGKRLRKYLKIQNISVNSAAKEIGISLVQLDHIFKGKNYSIKFVQRIVSRYPNLNPVWLITGESCMIKDPDKAVKRAAKKVKVAEIATKKADEVARKADEENKKIASQLTHTTEELATITRRLTTVEQEKEGLVKQLTIAKRRNTRLAVVKEETAKKLDVTEQEKEELIRDLIATKQIKEALAEKAEELAHEKSALLAQLSQFQNEQAQKKQDTEEVKNET